MSASVIHRRDFLAAAGAAAAAALTPTGATAQQGRRVTGVTSSGRYTDSLIFERKPFAWPGGKAVAVWVAPNVEVWDFDSNVEAALQPGGGLPGLDVINYASRDYGIRLGLPRIAEVLDSYGIRGTVALNAAVCEIYPKALALMTKRRWEFMGHGIANSRTLAGLPIDQERAVVQATLRTIEAATGAKVRGWLSPGQIETRNTPDLLAEAGIVYTADWCNDDQPYPMRVAKGELFSIPYSHVINDVELISKGGLTGPQYGQSLIDQFEQLLEDGRTHPRVMGIPLHPFLAGQPDRIGHLDQALKRISRAEGVWLATAGEIIDAYRKVKAGEASGS